MPRGTKRLVAALFAVAIAVTLFATTTGFDYGNVRWGMTVEEVAKATGAKDIGFDISNRFFRENTEELVVVGSWYGFRTFTLYGFDSQLLKSVAISIGDRKSFQFVMSSLRMRLGAPVSNSIHGGEKTFHWQTSRMIVEATEGFTNSVVFYQSKIDLTQIRKMKFNNETKL